MDEGELEIEQSATTPALYSTELNNLLFISLLPVSEHNVISSQIHHYNGNRQPPQALFR